MSDTCFRFHDLFAQLGLPNSDAEIADFIQRHRPLPGHVLLADAPFWDASQAAFIREKKAIDSPEWTPLIDQLSEALREDARFDAGRPPTATAALRILGISGSLRHGSFNTALLRAAQASVHAPHRLEIATLHGIPLYDGDAELSDGLPVAVQALRARIAQADGLLIATPEYNSGMPGVLKNAFDWISRVSATFPDVLKGKPVALVGATPGGFGTVAAQIHCLPMLRALGMLHWSSGRLAVSKAHTVLQTDVLTDTALVQQVSDFMGGFVHFAEQQAHFR